MREDVAADFQTFWQALHEPDDCLVLLDCAGKVLWSSDDVLSPDQGLDEALGDGVLENALVKALSSCQPETRREEPESMQL